MLVACEDGMRFLAFDAVVIRGRSVRDLSLPERILQMVDIYNIYIEQLPPGGRRPHPREFIGSGIQRLLTSDVGSFLLPLIVV